MPETIVFALTFATAVGCGLVGGVFFAFSTFVMRSLARLPTAQGIAAMQSINVLAVTPMFMTALFGTALGCLVLAVAGVIGWPSLLSTHLLAAGVLYLAGTIAVTMFCNVPRNQALAATAADGTNADRFWREYVRGWTMWNHVRTITSLAASALLIGGLCALH